MLNANARKNFTACGDAEAEMLLEKVLCEIRETLSGTGLCVCLGGSYGRGDGGVRIDRENGILYNDLDFFVFARKKSAGAENVLREIAIKYEHELKVDVDFSRIMSVKDIKTNAKRLMMQELKRGYRLVAGEDLLEKYLPELPAEKLPYSEACRLLLNRGMGLIFAGEKIAKNSDETDFILRNLYKAILGAGDAVMIANKSYRWNIADRLEWIENSDMLEAWKALYREAVEFKCAPHRQKKADMFEFWYAVRDFFRYAVLNCAGNESEEDIIKGIFRICRKNGELSMKNFVKYCVKSKFSALAKSRYCTMPAAALLVSDVYSALNTMSEMPIEQSKLYKHWLIFN